MKIFNSDPFGGLNKMMVPKVIGKKNTSFRGCGAINNALNCLNRFCNIFHELKIFLYEV